MSSLVIRIVSPRSAVDLTLPDDRPLGELLPRIAEVCGVAELVGHGAASWALAPQGGVALPDRSTLRDSGVLSGSVLHLAPQGGDRVAAAQAPAAPAPPPSPSPPARAVAEPPPPPPTPTPTMRTQEILPRRLSFLSRAGGAMAVAFGIGQPPREPITAPAGGTGAPSPASLTVKHGSPLSRARRTWRQSGYEAQLDAVIVTPRLHSCATIAVMSPKGGVGKTTITTLLGTLLAHLRRDRTLAIDTNPDYGSLGRTLAPDHNVFVDDLLEVLEHPALTSAKLGASLARSHHGLLVLPAPTDPERMARLDEDAYRTVIRRLQAMTGLILLDCGTGLQDPTARAALASANQIVLVSDGEPATASLVAEASPLLARSGAPITLVVNKLSGREGLDIDGFASYVSAAHALVTLPSEPKAAGALATGDFDWTTAPRSWRVAVRRLAAVLAADWERLGLTV